MSGLLITVAEFRHRTLNDLDALVRSLKDLTGRGGEEEENAWRCSLPAVAEAFASECFDDLHLYFGGKGRLALEYRLPSASYWCDVVMLGAINGNPSAVVVELKNWLVRADKPGPREGLMIRQGREELHPSDQVKGYVRYCQRFHSAVAEYRAQVHGCVLLTRDFFCQSYSLPPNDGLALEFPLFTLSPEEKPHLPRYFSERLTEPHQEFSEAFARGTYRQNRSFVKAIGEQLLNPAESPLELLDSQRRASHICRERIESSVLAKGGLRKTVLVVEGPPGSGKSIVAAHLWATLVCDTRLPEGNVTFVTTSTAQTSNWRRLYEEASDDRAARGLVVTANEYIPYTTHDIGRVNRSHADVLAGIEQWRENYRLLCQLLPDSHRTQDDHFLVSIVDEAHALINPEHRDARGQFGFAVHMGPQAYHIIRASVVSIFFMDPQQSFRERESTSIDDIRRWAVELGADFIEPVSLSGAQFRCAGSTEYVEWVDKVCSPRGEYKIQERATTYLTPFDFRVFNTPISLEEELRRHVAVGHTARLVASYAREWSTQGVSRPHALPNRLKDFNEPVIESGKTISWAKIWNYVPNGTDYTQFVRAPVGSPMRADPLCEVGCPYVVRGFDFDYVGLLWLGDLKWRSGSWSVDVDAVFETGLARHVARARAEGKSGPAHNALIEKLLQGYRILMTRAMRGLFVWFEDAETRTHVEKTFRSKFLL